MTSYQATIIYHPCHLLTLLETGNTRQGWYSTTNTLPVSVKHSIFKTCWTLLYINSSVKTFHNTGPIQHSANHGAIN